MHSTLCTMYEINIMTWRLVQHQQNCVVYMEEAPFMEDCCSLYISNVIRPPLSGSECQAGVLLINEMRRKSSKSN